MAAPGPQGEPPEAPRPPEEKLAEWTGLFLFAVGAYGTVYRSYTHHLSLWGVIPLDAFYTSLLLGGAVLMMWSSLWSPSRRPMSELGPAGRVLLVLRRAFSLLMLALLVWVALLR